MRADANNKEIDVFKLIASPLNTYVIMVNTMMPATNDVNRPGQNCPSYPDTAYRVASMKAHVIGTPNNINANL